MKARRKMRKLFNRDVESKEVIKIKMLDYVFILLRNDL